MQGNRILERQSFFSSFVIFWLSARPDICRILLHPYIPQFSPGHFTLQCWRCQFSMEMLNTNFTKFFFDFLFQNYKTTSIKATNMKQEHGLSHGEATDILFS